MRELHFVDVVDVEQLLEAMGQDVAPVADRIQRLLLPSYFPGGQPLTSNMRRFAFLCTHVPILGRVRMQSVAEAGQGCSAHQRRGLC